MGLDMYLHATVRRTEFETRSGETNFNATSEDTNSAKLDLISVYRMMGVDGIQADNYLSADLTFQAMYWRKSNAIHGWFCRNLDEEVKNCKEIPVSRKQLRKLQDDIQETLKTGSTRNFPPQTGFFFGSNEVDDWYWRDLKRTAEKLDDIFKSERMLNAHFTYSASW